MAEESVLRIPAKLEGMDVILAFVSLLLDTHGCNRLTLQKKALMRLLCIIHHNQEYGEDNDQLNIKRRLGDCLRFFWRWSDSSPDTPNTIVPHR